MPRPNSRQAVISSTILLILAIGVHLLFDALAPTTAMLLVAIFFTVFIPSKISTRVAVILSIAIVLVASVFDSNTGSRSTIVYQILLSLFLIGMTAWLVSIVKEFYANISFDKTHMTSLFENATEGIILTNKTGSIVLVNPAAEQMFGYHRSEMIGKRIEILIPENYRRNHVQLREGFLKSPQDRVMGHGRDLHGTKKNGENFPVEVSLSHYKRNNEPYVIAFVVDITRRKEIEKNMRRQQEELENVTRDIRKLNAQLEAKVEERTVILKEALVKLEQSQVELNEALQKERELNDIKSRFVSMASHEFRTPLSTILSSASLVGKYVTTEEQEKRDKHIFRIKDSVKHLNNILEDFLSLGRLNEGKVSAQVSSFDLQKLIHETVDEIKGLFKKDQQLLIDYDGATMIYSDKNLLKNIFINLLTNAIKFSNEAATIQIRTNVTATSANIAISDTGIGISPEDKEHLFTSFFRGKNVINIQGTGLGLHIVKRYVDLLGGELNLESELNKGTTVSFVIPVNHTS